MSRKWQKFWRRRKIETIPEPVFDPVQPGEVHTLSLLRQKSPLTSDLLC